MRVRFFQTGRSYQKRFVRTAPIVLELCVHNSLDIRVIGNFQTCLYQITPTIFTLYLMTLYIKIGT